MTTNTTTTTRPRFAYFSTGMVRDASTEFEVHAAGCQHVSRGDRKRAVGPYDIVSADSAEALVAAEVAHFEDQDQGWTAEDFRIFPCAAALAAAPEVEEPAEEPAEESAEESDEVTAEVAQAELDRRAHNRRAKRTGGARQEVADTDAARAAFGMSGPALKALAAS